MEPFEMEDLRHALDARTPEPCTARRAATLEILEKNLRSRQEFADASRPTLRTPKNKGSIWQKLEAEMTKWKKRSLLLGTSGVVTASLAMFVVVQMNPMENTAVSHPPGLMMERQMPKVSEELVSRSQVRTFRESEFATMDAVKMAPAPLAAKGIATSRMIAPIGGDIVAPPQAGDRFEDVAPSKIQITAENPVSTFSIDVDTASYATLRSYLERGQIPPSDAVRIEEMVNYFSYDYAPPEAGGPPFATHVASFETPWNVDTRLVHIGLQGIMPEIDERPPLDLVFLVDTSGSMRAADKLGLLKQSLKLMLPKLRAEDRVAVVTYAGSSGVALELTSASDVGAISSALDALTAGGGTAGAAGLKTAYGLLEKNEGEDRIGRVILATDGDFNVGLSGVEEMKEFISEKRETGAYLSVLGFGHGNYNDALMQTLAQNGNGHAAYIDSLTEARKALGDQLTGALFPIAGDVKVQVEFNPAVVGEYRLIGYETRSLAREDFNNDKVDAGDLGAGHSVTALYEVTPIGSPALMNDPLRYGARETPAGDDGEIGFVKLRWKAPGASTSQLVSTAIPNVDMTPSGEQRFAASIAGFGQILKGSPYLGDWDIENAIALAKEHGGADEWGYRAEALRLMQLYQDLKAIE